MNPIEHFNSGITVVHYNICPFVQRICTVLHSYEMPFDYYHVDIYANKPEWLNNLLPSGKVPALCIKGKVLGHDFGKLTTLTESTALMYLLNDLLDGALLPNDLVERAIHRNIFTIAELLHEQIRVLLISKQPEKIALALDHVAKLQAQLSRNIKTFTPINNKKVSMLEAILAPLFNLMFILQSWHFSGLISDCSRIKAWQVHLSQLPAFNQALTAHYEQDLANFVVREDGILSSKLTPLESI